MTHSAEPFNVVIPARHDSTRLPGKPLLELAGKPLILRTVEQVQRAGPETLVVATDDARIEAVCREAGVSVMMTGAAHQSGTDRMNEVADVLGWDADRIVINVQGDEPFIPPDNIIQVAKLLEMRTASIATLAAALDPSQLNDPNTVKVVCAKNGFALYFSRAVVPWLRDIEDVPPVQALRHIGVYGYRREALRAFAEAGPCALEQHERLEQLRALWQGWPIIVGLAKSAPPPGVDTPADLETARARFNSAN
ncbi:MAG: 3-deoxy-manno-octulosonate cytidylyltransferase [Pseudomonadota bacterium]